MIMLCSTSSILTEEKRREEKRSDFAREIDYSMRKQFESHVTKSR